MSLRARFVLYLVAVHLLLAGLAAWLVTRNRWWLIAAELVLVASFLTGLWLIGRFTSSLAFVDESAQLLEDSDFMSRVREMGHPQIDRLIRVYNRMVESLRLERVRLQEQHQFLSLVLQESPGGIVVLDFEGRIAMANPAAGRLLQAAPDVLVGRSLAALDPPLAGPLTALGPGERRVLALWGGRRVRAWHGTFLDRGFRRSFILLEELTEELRQSEKAAYEKLIRMLSHEVNNTVGASRSLLQSCLSYSDQLAPDDAADFTHALGVVIARTEQLNEFMRSFANVVRLPPPQRRPIDLRTLLDGIAGLLKAELDGRRIALRWEGERSLGLLPLDGTQMEQALLNILKNAMEAIGSDGRVTIRQSRRDGRPIVEIEDTGPGIPPDLRDQLFTPFFSTKEHGQGIGLTMVQEVLSNHGCTFSLESAPGGPTTFTIVFPVAGPRSQLEPSNRRTGPRS